MKVYYVISKAHKRIYYLSVDKRECEKYWNYEKFDEKYYAIEESKSETALAWIQGKIDRSILIKELEANYGK